MNVVSIRRNIARSVRRSVIIAQQNAGEWLELPHDPEVLQSLWVIFFNGGLFHVESSAALSNPYS